jgi:hypothetical protein
LLQRELGFGARQLVVRTSVRLVVHLPVNRREEKFLRDRRARFTARPLGSAATRRPSSRRRRDRPSAAAAHKKNRGFDGRSSVRNGNTI